MFSALETRSLDEVNVIQFLLDCHESLLEKNPKLSNKIKTYSVSSCVTRLYAIYENFIETAISDYLDSLSECIPFEDLPPELKSEYRLGISHILSKLDQGRYANLSHDNIIKWYYEANTGVRPYKFITNALTRHEQNFRLNILVNGFNKIQLKNIQSWLTNHPEILKLYPDGDKNIFQLLEAEVKEFIQLRNDASHGTLDSIVGRENLNRSCEMITAVIIAIGSYLRKSKIEHSLIANKINQIGIVTESFKKNGAFIAKFNKGINLSIAENIYFIDSSNCYEQKILSLQIDDTKLDKVITTTNDYEVGVKCAEFVKVQTKIFQYPIQTAPNSMQAIAAG